MDQNDKHAKFSLRTETAEALRADSFGLASIQLEVSITVTTGITDLWRQSRVPVPNGHSMEATSTVSGTRRCQQLCKESGTAFSRQTYMTEWPNLESVCAKVTFAPCLVLLPNHLYLASHKSTSYEVTTRTPQKYGIHAPNPSEQTGVQTTTKDPQCGSRSFKICSPTGWPRRGKREGALELRAFTRSSESFSVRPLFFFLCFLTVRCTLLASYFPVSHYTRPFPLIVCGTGHLVVNPGSG